MSVNYLTDAERPYRPEELRREFCFFVDVELRGQVYRRWFRNAADRRAWVILAGQKAILRNHGVEVADGA